MIGLLVPSLENPIFPALAQAMEERATEAGFASILCNTTAAAFREVDYVHMLLDRGADGMIFISCEMTNMSGDHDHYARLVEEGARIVFVNGALNSLHVPSVARRRAERGRARDAAPDRPRSHARSATSRGRTTTSRRARRRPAGERALRAAGLEPDGLVVYGRGLQRQGRPRGIAQPARHADAADRA